jgi:proteasome beta subunit
MSEEEAIDLAARALRAAMKRDSGSGEGINVVVITADRYEELSEERADQIIAAAKAA